MTRCFDKSSKNWCSVASWGVGIYAWSTIWNFFDLTWPQRPPSERVPYLSEKLDFWWSIPQKITSNGHFGASDDQTIRIRKFFKETCFNSYCWKVSFSCKMMSFAMKSYISIILDRKCITSRKIAGGETNVFPMPMWCGWYVGKKAIIFWHQHGFQQEYTWECRTYVIALVAQGIKKYSIEKDSGIVKIKLVSYFSQTNFWKFY